MRTIATTSHFWPKDHRQGPAHPDLACYPSPVGVRAQWRGTYSEAAWGAEQGALCSRQPPLLRPVPKAVTEGCLAVVRHPLPCALSLVVTPGVYSAPGPRTRREAVRNPGAHPPHRPPRRTRPPREGNACA